MTKNCSGLGGDNETEVGLSGVNDTAEIFANVNTVPVSLRNLSHCENCLASGLSGSATLL